LVLTPYPIKVATPDGGSLYLAIDQSFDIGPHPDFAGEHKLFTRSYWYGVYESDDVEHSTPIIAWHLESTNDDWPDPHAHAPLGDPLGRGPRLHIPTGSRMTVEKMLKFLLDEKLVEPAHGDWQEHLGDGQARFDAFQTQERN